MTSIIVASLADEGPGTLRAALRLAEASQAPVVISFAASLTGGVIRLDSLLSFGAGTAVANGDIDGDGTPDIAIDGGHLFGFGGFQPASGTRHLDVGAGATLTLAGLVLRNAYGSAPSGSADPAVGSISNAGSLTLKDVVFEGVRAHTDHEAAGSPRPADAATIHNREGADLTLDGVLLFSVASRSGGRVAVEGAPPDGPGSSAVAGVLNEGALTLGRFGIRDVEAGGPGVSFVASDAPGRTVIGVLNRGTIEALTEPGGPPPTIALADRARFIGISSAFLGVVDVDGGTGAALFAEAWLSGAQDGVSDALSIGFALADMIEGGLGNDTVFAGGGDDFVMGWQGRDVLHGEAGDDTLVGFDHFNRLFGGEGDDDLHIGDIVTGRGVSGFARADGTAHGGAGDDTFHLVNLGSVTLEGGAGFDMIVSAENSVFGALELDLLAGVATGPGGGLSARFTDMEGVEGGSRDDVLRGDGAANRLAGHGGDDLLQGRFGDDTLVGGDGADRLVGAGGADRLSGDDGNDALNAGAGDDALSGGRGHDTIHAAGGDDTADGGRGRDVIRAGGGDDSVGGGALHDLLLGGGGDDLLRGGKGRDTLAGGGGSDTLAGGEGLDTLVGGAGRDVFVFGLANARDRIEDFTPGVDRMAFEDAASLSDLRIVDLKFGAEIRHAGGVVLVAGLGADDFRLSDFDFLLEG